jgi:hypothetical protein
MMSGHLWTYYRIRALCRAPTTHDTAFTVRFLPKRTTKAHGAFLPGKDLCRAPWGKETHGTVLCRVK